MDNIPYAPTPQYPTYVNFNNNYNVLQLLSTVGLIQTRKICIRTMKTVLCYNCDTRRWAVHYVPAETALLTDPWYPSKGCLFVWKSVKIGFWSVNLLIPHQSRGQKKLTEIFRLSDLDFQIAYYLILLVWYTCIVYVERKKYFKCVYSLELCSFCFFFFLFSRLQILRSLDLLRKD